MAVALVREPSVPTQPPAAQRTLAVGLAVVVARVVAGVAAPFGARWRVFARETPTARTWAAHENPHCCRVVDGGSSGGVTTPATHIHTHTATHVVALPCS